MNSELDMVTVYRSMDATAKDDAEIIADLLSDAAIQAVLLDDSAPGVPEGVFEVQVPAVDAIRAEELIAANPLPDEVEEVDDSSELDLETIYHAGASITGEVEAMGIKNLLDSNGIAAVLVGDSVLPNFPFEIRVAHDQVDRARLLIAEAESAGPASAARDELESELGS